MIAVRLRDECRIARQDRSPKSNKVTVEPSLAMIGFMAARNPIDVGTGNSDIRQHPVTEPFEATTGDGAHKKVFKHVKYPC
jgi:hypothetical protein